MAVPTTEYVFKFIDEYGMTEFLKKFGDLLLKSIEILPEIKEKYPNEEDKIKLWQKLHGIDEPIVHEYATTFQPLSLQIPETKSKLIIHNTVFISSPQPTPSRWQRFWYKKLLGWEWENLEK